ncbi:MAG: hypothetical protein B655_1017 [Methanobacterium sp. Maddingley MBC34]|nr:MAG: hypothetical protein B655_1017 [Methanobacterium sp. Maddingley MBC34]
MVNKISEMNFNQEISKDKLFKVLKEEARSIHIQDIMRGSNFLKEDVKFMPPRERKDIIARFTKALFVRIKDIKDDHSHYSGYVDPDKLKNFLNIQNENIQNSQNLDEKCFYLIARVVSTYTAFVKEEPIHPVGTRFPGGFTLRLVDGVFLCPVKDKQKDTPSALCRFCVSVQDKSVN